jgi:hypothetical protein
VEAEIYVESVADLRLVNGIDLQVLTENAGRVGEGGCLGAPLQCYSEFQTFLYI